MSELFIFTDASVDTKTRIGYGAFLAVKNINQPFATLSAHVTIKQFENTSSTKLELETLLWAISELLPFETEQPMRVTSYSDSQNILGLPARRSRLEKADYYASNGKRLANAELYQEFYKLIDQHSFQIIKIDGHKPQSTKNDIDKIFSLVDKASRLALRKHKIARLPA